MSVSTQRLKHLEELRQAVSFAALNYEVWWVYKSSDTRPKYVEAMNQYKIFFSVGIHAHFVAMISALYRIFETRSDTHNLKALLATIASSSGKEATSSYEDRFTDLKPIWKKVSRIRNNAFSHHNASTTIDEVFEAASLTPNDIKQLIDGTRDLLNSISLEHDHSIHAFNTGAREDTLHLLDDLTILRGGI